MVHGLRARRAGWLVLAGLVLLLVACVFGAGPLFVLAVAFVVLGAVTPPWVAWSARGSRITRELAAGRVVEGTSLRTTIVVRRGVGSGGWGRLEVVDAASGTRVRLGGPDSPLRGARAVRLRVEVACPERGERVLAPPTLIATDPLGLAEARRDGAGGDGAATVLVLPRVEPVRWVGGAAGARLGGGTVDGRGEAHAATDLQGLRPYRPGTPASRIHWPALARGAGLVERQLQADADDRPLVVVDARHRAGDRAPLDAAVRAAASIVAELARGGGCGLLLGDRPRATAVDPELTGWPEIHARLAIVGTPADRSPRAAPALGAAGGRTGPLVYVAAVSHARLVSALSGAGARGGVVLVVPESEVVDGRPRGAGGRCVTALEVGGCRGFRLGAGRVGARRPPDAVPEVAAG